MGTFPSCCQASEHQLTVPRGTAAQRGLYAGPILSVVVAKERHSAGVPSSKVVILRGTLCIFPDVPVEVVKILTAIMEVV